MNIRDALKGQFHGAMVMLKDAVEHYPDQLWAVDGDSRSGWRVAYHALYFTQLYLLQSEQDFADVVWKKARPDAEDLWGGHPDVPPCTKAEILEYWDLVDSMIDRQIDILDLDTSESGFPWYSIGKLDHVIMNIRHLQEHVGQLRDRVFNHGGDLGWVGKA